MADCPTFYIIFLVVGKNKMKFPPRDFVKTQGLQVMNGWALKINILYIQNILKDLKTIQFGLNTQHCADQVNLEDFY